MKLVALGGACIAALAVSLTQPALAQSAPQSPAADNAASGGIADIVVTAQKRE